MQRNIKGSKFFLSMVSISSDLDRLLSHKNNIIREITPLANRSSRTPNVLSCSNYNLLNTLAPTMKIVLKIIIIIPLVGLSED